MLVFPSQSIVQLFNLMGCGERMWQKVGLFLIVLSTYRRYDKLSFKPFETSGICHHAGLGATGKDISTFSFGKTPFSSFAAPLQHPFRNRGLYSLSHALASTTALFAATFFLFTGHGNPPCCHGGSNPSIKSYSFENPERKTGLHDVILNRKTGSLSNFGVLKCLCTPGEDMH